MKAFISRTYHLAFTTGILYVIDEEEELYKCFTLELPNLGNKPNISCIPEGNYKVNRIVSPKKGLCFLLKDVPGRTNVQIHIGNFAAGSQVDTQGCILPGTNFKYVNPDPYLDITGSTDAMKKLLLILPPEFTLYIF